MKLVTFDDGKVGELRDGPTVNPKAHEAILDVIDPYVYQEALDLIARALLGPGDAAGCGRRPGARGAGGDVYDRGGGEGGEVTTAAGTSRAPRPTRRSRRCPSWITS